MRALIAGGVLLVLARTAAATPKQDLDRGRASFRAKDYQSAIQALNYLLYPAVLLGDRDDAIEAYILLGAASYEVGDRERARIELQNALRLDLDRSITTLGFSEGVVRLFDETKAELKVEIARDAEAKKLAEAREQLEAYRKSLVYYERRSYGVNFIPFGAGQFQNRETVRGYLFAASEAIAGGTSATLFFYLAGTYGLVNHDVPVGEARHVRTMQEIEIGTGAAFIGLYAFGVVDAIIHYKPRAQIQGDDSLLPANLRKLETPKKTSSLHFGPILMPNSMGIGVSWEN
ncbi:MAG TPA: hypothetical protein VGM88_24545 [Kofleriaceae bacterium]